MIQQEVNSEGVTTNKVQTEMPDVASGKQTYREYCASCHGEDGKGMGPVASELKTAPSDLTTLAKRHAGKFPEDYVANIGRLGKPTQAHGSSDMPDWGPIFNAQVNSTKCLYGGALRTFAPIWQLCRKMNRKWL